MKTAVGWLKEQYIQRGETLPSGVFEEAFELEKEHIIQANINGGLPDKNFNLELRIKEAEEYYKENYYRYDRVNLQNQEIMKSQGLGDTVAKVLKFFYIDRLADKIAHMLGYEDCGCKRRQNILNRMFPYTKKKK